MNKKILIYTKLLFYNLLIFTLKEIQKMIKLKIGDHEAQEFSDEQIHAFKNDLDVKEIKPYTYSVIHNHKSHEIAIAKIDKDTQTISLTIDGIATQVKYANKIDLLLEKMGIDTSAKTKLALLKAPMPGLVVEWYVKEGDHVQAGDKLLILEAMKMENAIKSTGEGVIKKIHASKGQAVEKNQLLIDFQ
jgi:biotin carboxyl carrier protein